MRASSMKSWPTSGGGAAGFASVAASGTTGFASGALATAEGTGCRASTGAAFATGGLVEQAHEVSASARKTHDCEEDIMAGVLHDATRARASNFAATRPRY